MENSLDKTALETIELLEARLRRIEYAVGTISAVNNAAEKTTAAQRLADLEHSLHQLASKSKVIQDLLRLHARHPDLFQSIEAHELPTTLDTSSILSIVLASASSYPSTASRLTSIMDVPIPAAEQSTQLIDLVPRIARVEAIQASQNFEISALRERSAALIQKWYITDVLHMGDSWAEIEGRIGHIEQRVRHATLAKRLDDDMI